MTATETTIAQDLTPIEAANLLTKLEAGSQAAWRSAHQTPQQSPTYESQFQTAADVDGVFRDLLSETLNNGMRRPGESVDRFAERAQAEAGRAVVPTAAASHALQQAAAKVILRRAGISPDDNAARLLSAPGTPLGQAYARAFSDAAAVRVRELRRCDPLPEPDRTPGAPHPDPFLAGRGWHVNEHGIYIRRLRSQPQAAPGPDKELEAG